MTEVYQDLGMEKFLQVIAENIFALFLSLMVFISFLLLCGLIYLIFFSWWLPTLQKNQNENIQEYNQMAIDSLFAAFLMGYFLLRSKQ